MTRASATLLVALCGLAPFGAAGGAALAQAAPVEAAPPHAPHEDLMPTGPSVEARLETIRQRVQAAVEYPAIAASRGVSGEARVSFEIASDGRAADVRMRSSSGSSALDRAAERAVVDAGVLPRLHGRVTVPVRFGLTDASADANRR